MDFRVGLGFLFYLVNFSEEGFFGEAGWFIYRFVVIFGVLVGVVDVDVVGV